MPIHASEIERSSMTKVESDWERKKERIIRDIDLILSGTWYKDEKYRSTFVSYEFENLIIELYKEFGWYICVGRDCFGCSELKLYPEKPKIIDKLRNTLFKRIF